jgi:tetratricopeptide (TPR) repeat protein
MLRQFNRFIILALLIGVTLYITLTNSDRATLHLGPALQVTANAGVLYLGIFAAGCIAASVVALFFGFKGHMRERHLLNVDKTRQAFFELFVKARNYMSAHEWNAARNVWEQILRKDPDNVIAKVELATCLDTLGDTREALRVLDILRAEKRCNAEILFKAAELNQKLGNDTAARDNIALIVSDFPSKRALESARNLSERMNRIEDALEYQNEIERAGYADESSASIKTRLLFMDLVRQSTNESTLREALQGFVKRHPACIEALEKLAALDVNAGRFEEAAELLVKAAKASGDQPSKWMQVVDLWITKAPGDFSKRADRALAAARSATRSNSGAARVRTELVVAQTLLALHKHEDAHTSLEGIPALAEREGVPFTGEIKQMHLALSGLCLSRLGRISETASLWQELTTQPEQLLSRSRGVPLPSERAEPSPALSTP